MSIMINGNTNTTFNHDEVSIFTSTIHPAGTGAGPLLHSERPTSLWAAEVAAAASKVVVSSFQIITSFFNIWDLKTYFI